MTNYEEDTALIQRVAQGDQSALSALYAQYGRLIYNLAWHILKNDASAEEVTQDVFLQVWKTPKRWDAERARLSTWLLSIARYTAIDYLRREQRRPPVAASPLEKLTHKLPRPHHADNPAYDNGQLIQQVMGTLPKAQRVVIAMAYYQGLTHEEISERLGVPLGTVKSRIRLGMDKLREGWLAATSEPETQSE